MPMLMFRFGQHGALKDNSEIVLPEEQLFAFLCEHHVVCQLARVARNLETHHGKYCPNQSEVTPLCRHKILA